MSARQAIAWVVVAASVAGTGACAKAPDAKVGTDDRADAGAIAAAAGAVTASADAGGDAGAEATGKRPVPGLPMPQRFPHVVWDAAGVDAASRGDAASDATR